MTEPHLGEDSHFWSGSWAVWRIDDNGNTFHVRGSLSRDEAERLADGFTTCGHKQMYWVERETGDLPGTTDTLARAHLRVARPTDNLAAVVAFYRDGLGFEVLSHFEGHAGFDGVMLGHRGARYHLEFTRKAGHAAGRAPTQDNLLVFYLPDAAEWWAAVDRMGRAGYRPVQSFNPYWDLRGKTFEDPDGYRVVLQNATWSG
jgi:catechol 2,3-dioxygenase-like lactoylglutathione lyase family enzyme